MTDFPNLLTMPLYKGRAYTKSGLVEKFESELWIGIVETAQDPATPAYPSQMPYLVAPPDANGNYQISFRNTAPGVTFTAKTCYGPKVKEFSNCVELQNITSGAVSITGSMIEIDPSNLTKPLSGDFILSVPKNCSVDVQPDLSCVLGARIRQCTTVANVVDKTEYTVGVVAEYAAGSGTTLMCQSVSIIVKVTANSDNTEFRPGSSVTVNRTVAVII